MILYKLKKVFFLMVFLISLSVLNLHGKAEIPKYEVPPSNVKIPNQKGYTGWKQIVDNKGNLIYEGYLKNGVFHGEGALYKTGTIVYSGNWSYGQYDGFGAAYYSNGTIRYEGDFVSGLLTGSGTYYHENENKSYEGNLKEGYREGFGTTYSIEGVEIESKQYIDWTIVFQGEPGGTGRWGISTNFSVLFFTGMVGDSNASAQYFDNNGKTVLQPSFQIESNKDYEIFIQGTDFTNESNTLFLDITRLKVQVANNTFIPITKTATKIDSNGSDINTRNLQFIFDLTESATKYNDFFYLTNIKDATDFSTTITISYVSL